MFKRLAQKLRPSKAQYVDKIRIEYGEILAQTDCESILFFMQPNLKWAGSLNQNVLQAAGKELDDFILEHVHTPKNGAVYKLPPCKTAYTNIFMAILPNWDGGNGFEERDMLNCYRHAIDQAQALGIKSIAIPAMGRDKRDFPHIRFARLALQGILEKVDSRIDHVKIMCIDRTMMATYLGLIHKLKHKNAS